MAARPSPEDVEAFLRIYDSSKVRIDAFHEEKLAWALRELERLRGWAGEAPTPGGGEGGGAHHAEGRRKKSRKKERKRKEKDRRRKKARKRKEKDTAMAVAASAAGGGADHTSGAGEDEASLASLSVSSSSSEASSSSSSSSSSSTSSSSAPSPPAAPLPPADSGELLARIDLYEEDLDRIIEFLQLNRTAFGKILKKFDKNTGMITRERRLEDLRRTHPYLDGKAFSGLKVRAQRLRLRCASPIQQGEDEEGSEDGEARTAAVPGKAPPSPRGAVPERPPKTGIGASQRGPSAAGRGALSAAALAKQQQQQQQQQQHSPPASSSSAGAAAAAAARQVPQGKAKRPTAAQAAALRKKRGEDASVDRAERYLTRMERGSAFFVENVPRNLPQFSAAEVGLGGRLGQGEFATVSAVTRFDVKESCHLCFFHRFQAVSIGGSAGEAEGGGAPGGAQRLHEPQLQLSGGGSEGDRSIPSIPEGDEAAPEAGSAAAAAAAVVEGGPLGTGAAAAPSVDSGGGSYIMNLDFTDDISDYDELDDDHDDEKHESRGFMKDHCLREGQPRYAVKQLRVDLKGDMVREAALDLAIEAKFLATLSHPNIIKQRGTSGVPGHSAFFIVLDRLEMDLTEKLAEWRTKKESDRSSNRLRSLLAGRDTSGRQNLVEQQIMVIYDVARALRYLHDNDIIYRDLKPDNVGFDIRGDVKLFDFGLTKELRPRDRIRTDEYRASGQTGSRRYMAPEVVLCKNYGLKADIYSFGMFFWEVMALKEPFPDYDVMTHSRLVVTKGQRPKMKRTWPKHVGDLIERCWSSDPKERPNIKNIYFSLKDMPELGRTSLSATERTKRLMDRSVDSRERLRLE
jgi:serine/threonine protein kinase